MREDLLSGLSTAEIKMHELEETLGSKERAAGVMRDHLVDRLGIDTSILGKHFVASSTEQVMGGIAIPLSVVGPLTVRGQHTQGQYFVPIATNEAGLVAGLNRGIKAVNASGGVEARIGRDFMTRAPIIELPDEDRARELADEINSQSELYDQMRAAAEDKATVSRLLGIEPIVDGRTVHLRFSYATGDAMGMNSATMYTREALQPLLDGNPDARLAALSGNLCTDKKQTKINVEKGRGKEVEVEVVLPREVLRDIYRVQADDLERLNELKNVRGSELAGTVGGHNGNAANVIAGIYAATGQDLAQIVESSSAFTHTKSHNGDLYLSVYLPNLELGTVGGGTMYGTARTCLQILQCYGPGENPGDNARRFAEITGAAVLAQELNLLGTLANDGELADSHGRLLAGRRGADAYNLRGRRNWLTIATQSLALLVDAAGASWGQSNSANEQDHVRAVQERINYRLKRIRSAA